MLPTIDISLIGVLLAIWNVFKTIWDWTSKAFNWIMQRALALFIGSKFWATAAFLTVAVVLIGALSTLLSTVAEYILTLSLSSSSVSQDVLNTLGFFIDGGELISLITYCFSSWAVYRACISLDFTRRFFQRTYTILSRGWKT